MGEDATGLRSLLTDPTLDTSTGQLMARLFVLSLARLAWGDRGGVGARAASVVTPLENSSTSYAPLAFGR